MIKKYWTHIKTNKYDIYLTSKTVYIFNKDGREIKKFKDLDYGYRGCVSPNEDLLVVKSSSGRIAVYSLDELQLIKKFRFSKIDGSQDDNFIFSPDGKYIFNIERHESTTKTALSIYNTSDFSLEERLFAKENDLVINWVEYDSELNSYFILGYYRDKETGRASKFFISKLIDKELKEMKFIDEKSHGFLCAAKFVEFAGFTEESYNWIFIFKNISLNELKLMDLSLSNLWKRTN